MGMILMPIHAQPISNWPTAPLRIIVPFPPGGANDIAARALSIALAPQLGQSVVVENRAGAGGLVGYTAAAQSKDGHTLIMASTSISLLPSLNPNAKYDLSRDFDAIGWVSSFPGVLVVPSASKFQNVNQLIAELQANPNKISCGNGGIGTTSHLAAELFSSVTSTACNHVPYRGEGALAPAIMAGDVDMAFSNLPGVLPHIKSGRIRALAMAANDPSGDLPNVRTLGSLGILNMEVLGWVVLLAGKGIPEDRLAYLDSLLQTALATDSVRKTFAAGGLVPVTGGRNKLQAYILQEQDRWGKLIKARGIKTE